MLSMNRAGNRAGWAGLSRANSGLGQNRDGPKLAWIFRAKILAAQPALKIGLVGPNILLKAKKIRASRAGSGHTGPSHIGPGQIWLGFFRANNLMAQAGPNSGWTGLAHQVGPILPPLSMNTTKNGSTYGRKTRFIRSMKAVGAFVKPNGITRNS